MNPGKTRLRPEGQAQWQQGHVTRDVRKFCIGQIRISELCSWPHQHSFPPQGKLWHLPSPPQTCTRVSWYPQLWQALRDLCSHFQYILAFPNYVYSVLEKVNVISLPQCLSERKLVFLKYADMASYGICHSVNGGAFQAFVFALQKSQWTQGCGGFMETGTYTRVLCSSVSQSAGAEKGVSQEAAAITHSQLL